jgi:hypothetical protein
MAKGGAEFVCEDEGFFFVVRSHRTVDSKGLKPFEVARGVPAVGKPGIHFMGRLRIDWACASSESVSEAFGILKLESCCTSQLRRWECGALPCIRKNLLRLFSSFFRISGRHSLRASVCQPSGHFVRKAEGRPPIDISKSRFCRFRVDHRISKIELKLNVKAVEFKPGTQSGSTKVLIPSRWPLKSPDWGCQPPKRRPDRQVARDFQLGIARLSLLELTR